MTGSSESYAGVRLLRRDLLRRAALGAGAAAVAGLLGACQPAAPAAQPTSPAPAAKPTEPAKAAAPAVKGVRQLVVANGGGALSEAFKKAYFQPFTQATGVQIVEAANDIAKLKAMVESRNVEWDVAQIDAALAAGAALQKLLEPIDYGVVKKDELLDGVAKEFYIQGDFAAATIGWSTKSFPNGGPKTWAEFWDQEKFKGKRGFWKRAPQTLEIALLADGVSPKQLYPLDVDRAFKSLDRVKQAATFWTGGAQSIQLLLDGEIDMTMIWNGRIQGPKEEGKPVDFTFNQTLLVGDGWVVPRGARNRAASLEFLAFAMTAPQQAVFAQNIPYGTVNKRAAERLTPEQRAKLPPAPTEPNVALQDFDWWANNEGPIAERFNQWLLT